MGSEPTETVSAAAAAPTGAAAASAGECAGREGQPAGNTAEALTFDLLQNAAYHADRLAHFTRLHRGVSFVSIVLGTGAVVGGLAKCPALAAAAGILVAVASALDLALDLRGQARSHERLRERVFSLMADIDEADGDPARLRTIRAALTRTYGEEAADMCVVNALAYNAAIQATHRNVDTNDLIPLGFVKRHLRHWARWPGDYLTGRELKRRAEKASGG